MPGRLSAVVPLSSSLTQLSGLAWITSSFIIRSDEAPPMVIFIVGALARLVHLPLGGGAGAGQW